MSQATFREEFCKRIAVFMPCSDTKLLIDIQVLPGFGNVNLTWPVDENGNLRTKGQYMLGQSGDTVLIRTFYQYPVWLPFMGSMSNLPNGSRLLSASAAFRNEPFGMAAGAGVGT
jgi:hypothetical protein